MTKYNPPKINSYFKKLLKVLYKYGSIVKMYIFFQAI